MMLGLALIVALSAGCMPTADRPVDVTGDVSATEPAEPADDTPADDTPAEEPRDEPGDETGADDPLEGGEWVLVGYGPEGALIELPAGALVTISFADGGLKGSAGCNSYFGGYQVSGDAIEVGPVGSTEMWCEGLMDLEDAYLATLSEATGFSLAPDGGRLTIASAIGVLVFEKPQPVAERPLTGTVWTLETIISGETAQSVLAGTQVTLEFTDERVSGSTGCNLYGAAYTLDGNAFMVEMMEVTLQYCSEELMTQEGTYLAALGAAEELTLEGGLLVIAYPDGELVFKPATDRPLEGTSWVLEGVAKGDAIVSTWIDVEITAEFIDGKVDGSAGCNRYFASYEIENESLSFGPAGSTMMMCDDERMEREREFLAALENVAGYEVKMDALTLHDAAGNPLLIFKAATDLPLEGTG